MPEGVAGGPLGQASLSHRAIDCLVDDGFMYVMPSLFAGLCVLPPIFLGKDAMLHALPSRFIA